MAEPRLLCLHGLGRGPSDWDAVRGRLAAHGAVAAPALPRDAAAALGVAQAAVVPGAIVIGHSMGGIVALRIARSKRAAVAGVVVTGCPFPVARNGRTRRQTALDYAGHRVAFVRSLAGRPAVDGPRRRSPAGLSGVARVLARPGRFDALFGGLAVPVLVVHARDDHHVPVDFALAAAARHGWEARLLEAGGHHAHLRAPDAWTAAVEPWLAAVSTSITHCGN
ncbi:MAG TPA: alpha/beta hydrolase [Gaiellales bacterium]|nr:alpha/beta hydrolase [Gaiellales bacterium]